MKEMAVVATPVQSPIPPTKGTNFECTYDLGVIEEDEENEANAIVACNASGISEWPATTIASIPSLLVCTQSS